MCFLSKEENIEKNWGVYKCVNVNEYIIFFNMNHIYDKMKYLDSSIAYILT